MSRNNRTCTDCKRAPQMQCLHCSNYVCMDCAQKHVASVNNQINVAQHLFNTKIHLLDQLRENSKKGLDKEYEKMIKQLITERDRCEREIDHLIETEKQQIAQNSKTLLDIPLNEVPAYIDQLSTKLSKLNEKTDFVKIASVPGQLQIRK
ncbi:unnamed protein product [Didymodactylos carnosus]|uniref:B box-type domain-containing protein n=1 Tax=Didymodactylos carnosus TaxID=1234261 RepID=A0A815GIL4_9BILA|nr:unnamed protein product [Didymodactylos carnosus]CAF1339322.1 unnamed protein product [Didymodactylos carnosus]CAF4101621.1 unnamed protein product [Didymodactylos carnosus]CAF4199066.1 unnamed protein product [Didymodactylos carnosus]